MDEAEDAKERNKAQRAHQYTEEETEEAVESKPAKANEVRGESVSEANEDLVPKEEEELQEL